MAAILSMYMRVRRAVRRRPQNMENDVSIYVPGVNRLWEPDLIGRSTDSISSRALGCHLWPTFSERPAFARKVVQALILDRSFKPAIHRGEDRWLPYGVHETETRASLAPPRSH